MLLFLDTEFTDPLDIDLISLGMVSDDGRHQFYAERSDFEDGWCNGFVRSAVLGHLGRAPAAVVDRDQLQLRLVDWFGQLPGPVTVACDSFTDWELLLDALGEARPGNLAGRVDLREAASSGGFQEAVCAYHAVAGQPWHHALHDALAHRVGWLAWSELQGESDKC